MCLMKAHLLVMMHFRRLLLCGEREGHVLAGTFGERLNTLGGALAGSADGDYQEFAAADFVDRGHAFGCRRDAELPDDFAGVLVIRADLAIRCRRNEDQSAGCYHGCSAWEERAGRFVRGHSGDALDCPIGHLPLDGARVQIDGRELGPGRSDGRKSVALEHEVVRDVVRGEVVLRWRRRWWRRWCIRICRRSS